MESHTIQMLLDNARVELRNKERREREMDTALQYKNSQGNNYGFTKT
jgi:hypothetical protein